MSGPLGSTSSCQLIHGIIRLLQCSMAVFGFLLALFGELIINLLINRLLI